MKSYILFSGGLDSLASLYLEKTIGGKSPELVYINYGQAVAKREIVAFDYFAEHFDVPRHIFHTADLPSPSWVTTGEVLHHTEDKEGIFIPGRNIYFLLLAAIRLYSTKSRSTQFILSSHLSDTISGDCSVQFMNTMSYMLSAGMSTPDYPQGYHVKSVLMEMGMTKEDVIRLVVTAGLPYDKTWSCYGDRISHCGICHQCKERQDLFRILGIEDKTKYLELK